MTARAPHVAVRLDSPAFKQDTFPFYARMRTAMPIFRAKGPRGEEAFVLTRYDDVLTLLKDDRFAKDPQHAMTPIQWARRRKPPALFAPLMRTMLDRDDPDHARLRRLVQTAFTSRRVENLEVRTREICDALLDRAARSASFDLIRDLALPLPVTVISELLGVPERDRRRFAGWSKAIISTSLTPFGVLTLMPRMAAFLRFLRLLVRAKRDRPGDDLVSALVLARDAEHAIDDDEVLSMIAILLSAGHETTTNLIGNGTLALLGHPTEWDRLRTESGLMPSAVEELLRFACPVETTTDRYATTDLVIGGAPVERGSLVLGSIASANRDEAVFPSTPTCSTWAAATIGI